MVARKSEQYMAELSRHNYVTPKSYLELFKIFSDLIRRKKQELSGARQRMNTGLEKARHCIITRKFMVHGLNSCI